MASIAVTAPGLTAGRFSASTSSRSSRRRSSSPPARASSRSPPRASSQSQGRQHERPRLARRGRAGSPRSPPTSARSGCSTTPGRSRASPASPRSWAARPSSRSTPHCGTRWSSTSRLEIDDACAATATATARPAPSRHPQLQQRAGDHRRRHVQPRQAARATALACTANIDTGRLPRTMPSQTFIALRRLKDNARQFLLQLKATADAPSACRNSEDADLRSAMAEACERAT